MALSGLNRLLFVRLLQRPRTNYIGDVMSDNWSKLIAIQAKLLVALGECQTDKGAMAYRSHYYAIRRIEYIDQLARAAIEKATSI